MSVPIKNATAYVYPSGQNVNSDGVLENPTLGDLTQVEGYFEETTPGEAFQALGVMLTQPAYFMCDLADMSAFAAESVMWIRMNGYQVFYNAFVVRGVPERHEVFNLADHVDIYLERMQFPPAVPT